MDFVYVEDIARANILAAKSDLVDEVFNVASGGETTLLELLQTLLKVIGRTDVQPEFLPERAINPVPRRLADITNAEKNWASSPRSSWKKVCAGSSSGAGRSSQTINTPITPRRQRRLRPRK